MKIEISQQPFIQENTRIIRFLRLEIGAEGKHSAEILFHYERSVFIGEEDKETGFRNELIDYRKVGVLKATNEIKVDEQGNITEKGMIGEYDFYISAIFSGKYTKEELIMFVIKNADAHKRFN